MDAISPSLRKLATSQGFSLDRRLTDGEECVSVFEGSVLHGVPVGHAVAETSGGWEAFAKRGALYSDELGLFANLDEAMVAVMHRAAEGRLRGRR